MIDPGERAPEAALREVLEETGHRGRLVGEKLEDIEYWYVDKYSGSPKRVHKKVTFFVLELEKEGERAPDEKEVAEVRFLSCPDAIAAIEFASERKVLEAARARLNVL
jgi:8-oxo-dGTP diphosphatase